MAVAEHPGESRPVLRTVLENYKPEVVQHLNSNTTFLTTLARHHFISTEDILKYERIDDREKRNRVLVQALLRQDASQAPSDDYQKFLDALRRSGQGHLVAMMTNADRESHLVNEYYKELNTHLRNITAFITTESRRAKVRFDDDEENNEEEEAEEGEISSSSGPPTSSREALTEFLFRVHRTTRTTLVQFDRCRQVISKLHQDCDDVARKNAELTSRVREASQLVEDIRVRQGMTAHPAQRPPSAERRTTLPAIGHPKSEQEVSDRQDSHVVAQDLTSPANVMVCQLVELKHCLKERDGGTQRAVIIMDNMLEDLRERRTALLKHDGIKRAELVENKYTVQLPQLEHREFTDTDPLNIKMDELSNEMQNYVEEERQLSHQAVLTRFQPGSAHRNFDQVDKDLGLLQRELKRNDKDRALLLAANIIHTTQAERDQSIKTVDELQRVVHARRLRLQESSATFPMRMSRRHVVPKRAVAKRVKPGECSISKRLGSLKEEVKQYIDLEMDMNQKNKASTLRQKQDFESSTRKQRNEAKDLEKRLREAQNERDKYKRLYEQEKSINLTKKAQQDKMAAARKTVPAQQPQQRDTRDADVYRERRIGKPKLTPRARDLMQMKDGPVRRKAAMVRPIQLLQEEERKANTDILTSRADHGIKAVSERT